jgi:hypothetical protein
MGCHAFGVIPDLACSLFGTEYLRFRLAGKLMLDDFAGRIPLGAYADAIGLECASSECVLAGSLLFNDIDHFLN